MLKPTELQLERVLVALEALGAITAREAVERLVKGRADELAVSLEPWATEGRPWTAYLLGAVLSELNHHALQDGRALTCERRHGAGSLWRVGRPHAPPRPRERRARPPLLFTAYGAEHTLEDLSARSGLTTNLLYKRIVIGGWAPERACEEGARQSKATCIAFTHDALGGIIRAGERFTVPELARRTGQPERRLSHRYQAGLTPDEIVDPARRNRDPRIDDLTGKRFGRLVVLGPAQRIWGNGQRIWRCQCNCGSAEKEIVGFTLLRKTRPVRSCGCLTTAAAVARSKDRAVRYDIFGELLTIPELAVLSDVPDQTLRRRIRMGIQATVAAFGETEGAVAV